MDNTIAGVTETGETVTPQQALDKLAAIVRKAKNYPTNELFEKLATIEHERWADWQKYMHSKMFAGGDYMCLAKPMFEYWERQINTPYEQLSEREKDSDREQVMRYWNLIDEGIQGIGKEEK